MKNIANNNIQRFLLNKWTSINILIFLELFLGLFFLFVSSYFGYHFLEWLGWILIGSCSTIALEYYFIYVKGDMNEQIS